MNFQLGPEETAFRYRVAQFLDRELSSEVRQEYEQRGLPGSLYYQFLKRVAAQGWLGMTWPREYGGKGLPPIYRFILVEELARRGVEYRNMGESIVAPTLILYGSEVQKQEFLPRIARGEVVFSLLYSEPSAGSDLASLKLEAKAQDGGYLLKGEKIFSSEADTADYAWAAARTDPQAPKHKGISVFIVKLNHPGIAIRPLITMAGDRRFNRVSIDHVWVDKKYLVGEENRGWRYIAVALDFERATVGAALFLGNATSLLQELINGIKERRWPQGRLVRFKLTQGVIELEVLRMLSYNLLWLMGKGRVPNYEASMVKLFASELNQRLAQTAMEIQGLYGLPRDRLSLFYLRSRTHSVAGGTSEVQRNIIALRGLGLPPG